MSNYSKFNAEDVLKTVEDLIEKLDIKREHCSYRPRYYIGDVCDKLNIFDWWTNWLSKSQLLDMKKFLKEAIKLGYKGHVCFKVGATGCANGMWASKNESTNSYSPDGDCLYKSFTCEYNNWSFKYKDKWYPTDDDNKKGEIRTIKELELYHSEITKEKEVINEMENIKENITKEDKLYNIILGLLEYAQDNNMYEVSRNEMIVEMIDKKYLTEDDLKLLDEGCIYGLIENLEEEGFKNGK